ncbi:SCO family protein [Undibacterium sp. TJN25]|uniref:SCO family protein n=1 Tax=Undibacterium sp. TJN25 TaxID=3413056 RepID=UPI003BF3EFA3
MDTAAGSSSGSARNAAPTMLALALLFVLGVAAIYHGTDKFRVVSTEEARRLDIAEHPRKVPDAALSDAGGRKLDLYRTLGQDGRVSIVTFIYTRCNVVCSVLGNEFQQMQQTLQQRGLQHQLRLLSISFDATDGPAQLSSYAIRMKADPQDWQMLSVDTAAQRSSLLNSFGIVVVPAPLGEFQHNAAFHVVTPDGRLSRIFDYDQPEAALAYALSLSSRHPQIAQKNGEDSQAEARTGAAL